MTRQCTERRQVRAMSEDVAGGRLLRVGEELKLVLLGLRHEVTARRARRRPGGARRTRAGSGARHAQPVRPLGSEHPVHGRCGPSIHHTHHR